MMIVVSRRIAWLLTMFLSALAGCPSAREPAQPVEALPFVGQEIRLGVPAEMTFRTTWVGPLNEWAAQTGARYTLTEFPARDGTETFTPFSGDDRQTLAIFPLDQAGELFAAGELAAIPEPVQVNGEGGIFWSDLFGGLSGKIAARKGVPYFLPLSCPVLVCYYRHDLLSAKGLSPPQTWDDYQQLLDKLENWAPGLDAVEPWSESFRATMFLARAVSFAQHPSHYSLFFDIETGDPLIDSPGFVRALDASLAAVAKMPSPVNSFDPADCRAAIIQGRAALAIAFESPAPETSATGGAVSRTAAEGPGQMSIGFVRLPGSREFYNPTRRTWEPPADKGIHQVTLCGFAGLAVGASARNTPLQSEAAWNALARVGGPHLTSGFPPGIIGLCRESQVQNPGDAIGPGLEGDETTAYAGVVAQAFRDTRLVSELPVAGRAEFRRALATSLADALAGSQTSEQALQKTAREWRAIVDRIGAATIRDNYRLNLGLSPMARRN